jgi:hypothetical protein
MDVHRCWSGELGLCSFGLWWLWEFVIIEVGPSQMALLFGLCEWPMLRRVSVLPISTALRGG